jgi:hypothetical protein
MNQASPSGNLSGVLSIRMRDFRYVSVDIVGADDAKHFELVLET